MRTVLVLPLVSVLAGCAVVPPSAWDFDPAQRSVEKALPAQEFALLTRQLAQLQIERNEIRARIAAERDVRQRQRLYQELHRVGMQLSPLERRLGMATSS